MALMLDANGRLIGSPLDAMNDPHSALPVNPAAAIPIRDLAPTPTNDPYAPGGAAGSFDRGLRKSIQDIGPTFSALGGVANDALGNTEAGNDTLRKASAEMEFNAARGPVTPDLATARKTGDWGGYVAGKLGSVAPDMAMMAIPGGVAGTVARGVGGSMARMGVEAAAGQIARTVAERQLASGVLKLAPEVVAEQGEAAATRAALAQATDAALPAATRRVAKFGADPTKLVDAAGHAGTFAGTAAGALPGAVAGSASDVAESADPQAAAQKALAGGAVEASLMAVVPGRALAKLGAAPTAAETIAREAGSFLPKVLKASAKEGALMAGLSVPQTATALATHGWINGNIDTMPPGALDQYLDGIVSGGMLGAAFGGGAEAAHALPGAIRAHLTRFQNATDNALTRAKDALAPHFDAATSAISALAAKASGKAGEVVGTEEFGNGIKTAQSALDALGEHAAKVGGAAKDAYSSAKDLLGQLKTKAAGSDAFVSLSDKFARVMDQLEMRIRPSVHAEAKDGFNEVHSSLEDPQAKDAFANAFTAAYVDNRPSFKSDPKAATLNTQFSALQQAMKDVTTDSARNELRGKLADLMEKNATDSATEATQPGSHADAFNENLSSLDGGGAQADEIPSAFGGHDNLDEISKRHQAFVDGEGLKGPSAKDSIPVKMETPLQNAIASHIDPHDPIWRSGPDTVRDMTRSAEKLFTGEKPTGPDLTNIDLLKQYVGPDEVAKWAAHGPAWAERNKLVERTAPDPVKAPHEMSTPELRDHIVAADQGTPEHTAAQAELRDRIEKTGAKFTENNQTDVSRAKWAAKDPRNNPSTIGIEPTTIEPSAAAKAAAAKYGHEAKPETRQQALQLDNLVSAKLGEQPGIGPKAAMHEVFGDLAVAGVKVDPNTITSGKVWASKDGTSELHINPNELAGLRRPFKENSAAEILKSHRDAGAAPSGEKLPKAKDVAKAREKGLIQETASYEEGQKKKYTQEVSRQAEEDAPKLGAREPPPPDKGGGVADVTLGKNPHAAEVAALRKAYDAAKTPAERRVVSVEHGTKIGEAELRRQQLDGTISNKRMVNELKRLHDPDGKAAIKYAKDAVAGKFDSESRASEQKADRNRMERGEDKVDVEKYGEDDVAPSDNLAFDRQNRDQPENPRPKTTPLDEQVLKDLAKKDEATQARTRADEDIAVGFKEADKNAGPHDHAKEARMLNAVLAKMGIDSPVKVEPLPPSMRATTGGKHKGDTIYINPNLRGKERIEVLAHELGHHIIEHELGHEFEKASPELRDALLAEHAKWMKEQFGGNRIVTDVLASRKPFFRGERMTRESDLTSTNDLSAAKFEYLYSDHEFLADHIARALTSGAEGQGIIGKFFSGLANQFKRAYDALFGTAEGKKYAPADSVDKWVKSLFDRTTNDVKDALNMGVSHEEAKAATRAAFTNAHGVVGDKVSGLPFRNFARFANTVLTESERRIFARALDRGVVERQLRKQYGHDQLMMKLLESPERRPDALIYLAHMEYQAGRLNLGPAATEPMRMLTNGLFKIAGLAGSNEFSLRLMKDFEDLKAARKAGNVYDVRAKEAADRGAAQGILNSATSIARMVGGAIRPLLWGALDRIHQTQNPTLRKIAGLVKLYSSEPGKDARHDMLNARTTATQLFVNKSTDILGKLTPEQSKAMVNALQRGETTHTDAKVADAVKSMHALMRQAHAYATDAGIHMGEIKNYWPVTMDAGEVAKRAGDFKALMSQPKFAAAIKAKGLDVDKLHTLAMSESGNDGAVDSMAPAFSAKNNRLMDFVYKHGNADDIAKFAEFQNHDPAEVLAPYLQGLVNRAEFARRFGEKGERLNMLLDRAVKNGAKPEDVQLTRDFVNASIGHYGVNGSRILSSIVGPEKAAKWNPKIGKVSDGLMTYQNVRVLPLALLSSLADPMGIFVRSGGDFTGGWKGFRDGLDALKSQPHYLKELAHALGIAEDYMNVDGLRNNYSTSNGGPVSRKINNAVFKLNGLTQWTKATRFMALSVGQGFLLRHAEGGSKHSDRYLFELGVKASDIKPGDKPGTIKLMTPEEREAAGEKSAAVKADDRVRKGLVRFVEDSILRTNASQHPIYMNDPVMKVFSQYKQFAYAFEQQIIERAFHELKYFDNYKVLVPFLAYAPITVFAEMLRGGIQYGASGNPNRDGWGPAEYAGMGLQRAGVLGPKAEAGIQALEGKQYGHMIGLPDFGPTFSQAKEIGRTAEGNASLGHTVADALPASPLYVHHIYGAKHGSGTGQHDVSGEASDG